MHNFEKNKGMEFPGLTSQTNQPLSVSQSDQAPDSINEPELDPELKRFLIEWTGSALPSPKIQQFIGIVRRLAAAPLQRYRAGLWQSGLCADGMPIELSLSIGENANLGFRLTSDITDPRLSRRDQVTAYKRQARWLVSAIRANNDAIDSLIDSHLISAPSTSRFLAWHGIGVGPNEPWSARLYLNCTWLSTQDAIALSANCLERPEVELLRKSTIFERNGIALIGYDFTADGVDKVKFYTRLMEFNPDQICDTAHKFGDRNGDRLIRMAMTAAGDRLISEPNMAGFGVGIRPGTGRWGIKIALHATGLGLHTLSAASTSALAVLRDEKGGISEIDAQPRKDVDCSPLKPTILAFTTSVGRVMAELYFKPPA